ncbi:MAG: hypothetical protein QOE11_727, partial [Solirubrobacteraceae bacterium]|nr:hypothetical protein [Solirubrobacteraceae bacterium]
MFRLADVNDAARENAGLTRDQMIGATVEDLGGNGPRGRRDMLTALTRDDTVSREISHVFASTGEVRRLQVFYVRLGPRHVLNFNSDITSQRDAEERLRISEDRYRALVAGANEGIWLVDPSGSTTFANGKVGRMLGRPVAHIVAGNLLDFVDERDRPVVAASLECPLDTPEAFEARFRHSDGRELLCLLSVNAMPSDRTASSTLCVLADMTALQRERELRLATERQFRRMVETTSEGVWTGDREGRTTFINRAGARMLGLDADEIVGRPIGDLVAEPADAAAVKTKLAGNCQAVRGEFRLARADGTPVDVIASLSLLRSEDGQVNGALAMFSDVTQMKREQADLRESRERFAQVFEEAPAGMVFIAAGHLARGRFLGANRAFRELIGYSEAQLLEKDILSVTHADDVPAESALAHDLFEGLRPEYALDKRFERADGEVVWTRFRAHVLRDERGTPLYGLGVAVDLSAEKAALSAAADAGARAHALLESTPDAVVEVAADGTVEDLNDAAVRMLGLDRRAAEGRPVADTLVAERLRLRFREALVDWQRAAREGHIIEPADTTMTRADGSEFPAAVTITPVAGAEPPRLTLYVRNLGVHDRAEAARREAEERFELLFRDGPAAVALIDVDGRLSD